MSVFDRVVRLVAVLWLLLSTVVVLLWFWDVVTVEFAVKTVATLTAAWIVGGAAASMVWQKPTDGGAK